MPPQAILKPLAELHSNEDNPRHISDEAFQSLKKSIQDFPEMLELRPIICDETGMILGGNMRYKAAQELGIESLPVIIAEGLTEAQKRQFIIKDNVPFGEWEWQILSAQWNMEELQGWGLQIPGFAFTPDALSDGFSLPEGAKQPFQDMNFKLSDEQAQAVKEALQLMKSEEGFDSYENFGNKNENGNALYQITKQWVEQRTLSLK